MNNIPSSESMQNFHQRKVAIRVKITTRGILFKRTANRYFVLTKHEITIIKIYATGGSVERRLPTSLLKYM